MTANPFLDRRSSDLDRIIPPKDKAERQAFWIAHGNDSLAQKGMHGLQWVCVNESYSIVPRR